MFTKCIENGYITFLSDDADSLAEFDIEITEEEYNNILELVENKPEDTDEIVYMLQADTLEYMPTERPPAPPAPEPTYTLDEAAAIIADEVASDE